MNENNDYIFGGKITKNYDFLMGIGKCNPLGGNNIPLVVFPVRTKCIITDIRVGYLCFLRKTIKVSWEFRKNPILLIKLKNSYLELRNNYGKFIQVNSNILSITEQQDYLINLILHIFLDYQKNSCIDCNNNKTQNKKPKLILVKKIDE